VPEQRDALIGELVAPDARPGSGVDHLPLVGRHSRRVRFASSSRSPATQGFDLTVRRVAA
jgi:hypothetical protein